MDYFGSSCFAGEAQLDGLGQGNADLFPAPIPPSRRDLALLLDRRKIEEASISGAHLLTQSVIQRKLHFEFELADAIIQRFFRDESLEKMVARIIGRSIHTSAD